MVFIYKNYTEFIEKWVPNTAYDGYVYALELDGGNYIKVGSTINCKGRIRCHCTYRTSEFKGHVLRIAVVPINDHVFIESEIHGKLMEYHWSTPYKSWETYGKTGIFQTINENMFDYVIKNVLCYYERQK